MDTLRQFQIDAFAQIAHFGNPAAVVPLEEWLTEKQMQGIAMENNLAETAFFVPAPKDDEADFHLRWFTPMAEVGLCGHATLASAHALFAELGFDKPEIVFRTLSGLLKVKRLPHAERDMYCEHKLQLDFPETPMRRDEDPELLLRVTEALGAQPREVYQSMDLVCVFDRFEQIEGLTPSMEKLAAFTDVRAVAVTALADGGGVPGRAMIGSPEFDFVARMFAPRLGVSEDPVTGSLYTMLAPYWGEKLGKLEMTAYQLSTRGGEVYLTLDPANHPGRVFIAGHAITTIRSEMPVPYNPIDKFCPDWEEEKKFMVFTKRADDTGA
ncbi:MAG: PhzF family phenazine biosynthesis protein [Phycisphaerales bacterium]|jgi:PhzF family phenazine biosynthesis protein